jgi:hypothetical protein
MLPVTITFVADLDDYLTHQLFIASKSPSITAKRKRNKYVVAILFLLAGLTFFATQNMAIGAALACIGIAWFFFYPRWEAKQFVKQIQAMLADSLKTPANSQTTLILERESIHASDEKHSTRIETKNITHIVEIPKLILLRFKDGTSFLVPKSKIENPDDFENGLHELARHLDIKYNEERNWKWK